MNDNSSFKSCEHGHRDDGRGRCIDCGEFTTVCDPATCSICKGEYLGWGNNAYPFDGRCCDDCDNRFTTPARMLRIDPDNALIPILREFAVLGRINAQAAAVAAEFAKAHRGGAK